MIIPSHTIHLWVAELPDFAVDEPSLLATLSPDEVQRAMRFRFPQHRQRFIITRGLLRKTLSFYTGIAPEKIIFSYSAHGKPCLQDNNSLQFNVSHSADLAIFALTMNHEIGVDIQKIEPHFKESIAKRFFNPQEYLQLMNLPESERIKGFYQMWSHKEALIKMLGQGLLTQLSDFSVNLSHDKESVILNSLEHPVTVQSLSVPPDYQAAVAMAGIIENIEYKQCAL